MGSGPRSTNPDAAGSGLEAVATTARPAFQAAQLLGRAIGAGLFAITPAGERGMCCKAIKLGNARVFPVTTL